MMDTEIRCFRKPEVGDDETEVSRQFKVEAVKPVRERGVSVAQAGRDQGPADVDRGLSALALVAFDGFQPFKTPLRLQHVLELALIFDPIRFLQVVVSEILRAACPSFVE